MGWGSQPSACAGHDVAAVVAVSFLLSYGLGTMTAMSITAGVFGEGSMRLGKVVNNPDLPKNLSLVSSLVAIGFGLYWIVQAEFLKT